MDVKKIGKIPDGGGWRVRAWPTSHHGREDAAAQDRLRLRPLSGRRPLSARLLRDLPSPGRRAGLRLSQEWGLQPYQVSLAWLLSRPAVASAIVGAETAEEVTANATAADVTLDQAQLDALTALPAGKDS